MIHNSLRGEELRHLRSLMRKLLPLNPFFTGGRRGQPHPQMTNI